MKKILITEFMEQDLSIKLNIQTEIKSKQSVNVGFKASDMHWFDENGMSL